MQMIFALVRRQGRRGLLLMVAVSLLIMSLPLQTIAAQVTPKSVLAENHQPTVALEWMNLLYDRILAEGWNPPAAARLYGYAGVTLYEAVLPGMPINNTFGGQLNGLGDLPLADPDTEYDWPLSATGALSTVLSKILKVDNADTQKAIKALREKQIAARKAEGVKDAVIKRSLAHGDAVGGGVLNWVAGDQYAETRNMQWDMPIGDEYWVITTPGTKPVEPFWGQIRPFVMSYGGECNVRQRVLFDTEKTSTFYLQAMEVKEVGEDLTAEQKDIALYWLDNLQETGTPAGHWVLIEVQLAELLKLPLSRTAEMFALVNVAMADAFIACWEAKYRYNLLRPETYIQKHIRRQWKPYIQTPAFPEFPSGHSVVSAAAADVLTFMFGPVAFTDRAKTRFGMRPRFYTSFEAAAQEAAISRLYGGIHYRNAIEAGMAMGRCVARRVTTSIDMKPVPQGE
jgi:membrane-associated phospholipid phosphatase